MSGALGSLCKIVQLSHARVSACTSLAAVTIVGGIGDTSSWLQKLRPNFSASSTSDVSSSGRTLSAWHYLWFSPENNTPKSMRWAGLEFVVDPQALIRPVTPTTNIILITQRMRHGQWQDPRQIGSRMKLTRGSTSFLDIRVRFLCDEQTFSLARVSHPS